MSTTSYLGRKVDVLFSDSWHEGGQFRIMETLGTDLQVCTGVQKLSQTVALLLMTRRGSCLSDELFGTTLLDRLEGSVNNEMQLTSLFNLAVVEIRNYLALNTPDSAPSDEILTKLELVSFSHINGGIALNIKITTAAGSNRVVVVPVGVPIK